jgi:hypothetical protein
MYAIAKTSRRPDSNKIAIAILSKFYNGLKMSIKSQSDGFKSIV